MPVTDLDYDVMLEAIRLHVEYANTSDPGKIAQIVNRRASLIHGLGAVCPLASIQNMASRYRNTEYEKEAHDWIFGVTVGWGDRLEAVAEKYGWDAHSVLRLRLLHGSYQTMLHGVSDDRIRTLRMLFAGLFAEVGMGVQPPTPQPPPAPRDTRTTEERLGAILDERMATEQFKVG